MAVYRVACMSEKNVPLKGIRVEAVSLADFPDISATSRTGEDGVVTFSGLTGPHWFRPLELRVSGGVGERNWSGRVDVQIVGSLGEGMNVDYVVDPDNMGTHTTLESAVDAAIATNADKSIWVCKSVTENDIEIGGLDSGATLTISSHSRNTVVISAGASNDIFKQTSGGGDSSGGLRFRNIGFYVQTNANAIFQNGDTGGAMSEIRNLIFEDCMFNEVTGGGYLMRGVGALAAMGNTRLVVRDCEGIFTSFYYNTSTPPDSLFAWNNDLTITQWWGLSTTGIDAADTSYVEGGRYIVTAAQVISLNGNNDGWTFKNLIVRSACSGAHFITSGASTNVKGITFESITFIAGANDTDFADFRSTAAAGSQGRNLFVHGIHGLIEAGVTPTGTFLIVGTDNIDPYVSDIWAPDWPTVYSGPTITPAVPPVIDHIIDADGDTQIQVEESADEDIIRFDIEGTERMTLDGTKLDLLNSTYLDANDVQLPLIGSPTFTHVEHMNTVFHSTGWFSGGTITDAGAGAINVAAGTGAIRATDSQTAQLLLFDFPASNGLAITDGTIRYIGVEYNAGTPQIVVRTTNNFDLNTDFPLGTVVREGATLHIQNAPWEIGDHANFMIQRMGGTQPIARDKDVGGIIFSETGTRNIAVTTGQLWRWLTPFVIGALDTDPGGAADTFDGYSSQGKEDTGIAAWPNTVYDDGAGGVGTLTTMGNNKWANLWFYIELDSELVMVYGTAQYNTQAEAENEAVPSVLPNRLQVHGILAARFTFQKSAATAAEIASAFDLTLPSVGVVDHGNLAGLADPDHINIADADGDTQIQVEESGDEDVIRFDTAGTERLNIGATGVFTFAATARLDMGDATELEIPNSAGPLAFLNDGDIAIDTTVADWSHGIINYLSGEVMGVVAMPSVQFTNPSDGYAPVYDATADEFQMAPVISIVTPATYTTSNSVTDRSFNANGTSIDELADVLATLIADLQSAEILQ